MSNEGASLESRLHQTIEQLLNLSEQNATLRSENAALKNKLRLIEAVKESVDIPAPTQEQPEKCMLTTSKDAFTLSKAEKIELFRNLFRGREDVVSGGVKLQRNRRFKNA